MSIKERLFYNLMYLLPGRPPWDTGVSPPELVDFIERHPPGRALDLGCGTGTNALTLARSGWEVIGIDFARRAIYAARRKAHQSDLNILFHVGDAAHPKVEGSFDLVLDIGCFHSLSTKNREDYALNLEKLLSPNGSYLLYAFFRKPEESGPGLLEEDLQVLSSRLYLADRKDGTERGLRQSAWFTFIKQEKIVG
jgi:SAM-dependent methyltransferase